MPEDQKVPALHREVLGGTLGGALVKDKLFGYVAYQELHDGDGEIRHSSRLTVPFGLNDSNRTAAGLATLANNNFIIPDGGTPIAPGQIDPVALAMFQFKLPNGQYMIPSDDGNVPTPIIPDNAYVPGTAVFKAHQAVANVDWNRSSSDILSFVQVLLPG